MSPGAARATTILGEPAALPLALAPIGLCGMQHGDGEILACRAAQAAGIPFCLSTMSICSIEDVAAAVGKPFWFQLYVMKDRGFVRGADRARRRRQMQRARPHRRSAGPRPAPPRHQERPDRAAGNALRNIIEIATKPAWALSIARGKRRTFGNLAGHVRGMEDVNSLAQWTNSQFDASLNWKDVEWIASLWPGKLILKGILDVEDARIAAKTGAAALVVSNHGGRQLDGAPSSISALPAVADAVGSSMEILFDGGIRSGQDVMRAHCARRPRLPERPRLRLRSRRRRTGRCRTRDRDHPQRARHQHGADRRQPRRGNRPPRHCGHVSGRSSRSSPQPALSGCPVRKCCERNNAARAFVFGRIGATKRSRTRAPTWMRSGQDR